MSKMPPYVSDTELLSDTEMRSRSPPAVSNPDTLPVPDEPDPSTVTTFSYATEMAKRREGIFPFHSPY